MASKGNKKLVFHKGEKQHFVREEDNADSRLIFRGELIDVRR